MSTKKKTDNKLQDKGDRKTDNNSDVQSPAQPTMILDKKKVNDKIRESRRKEFKVKIYPSPFKHVKMRIKKATPRVNSAGLAQVDSDDRIISTYEDLNKAIQIPGTTKTLKPALRADGLNTGLNVIVNNPYHDEDVYYPAWGEKVLKNKKKALLQNILEYKHKKDLGYYTNQHFNTINPSDKLASLPFFLTDRCNVILDGTMLVLDVKNNPIDEIKYYMLLAHSYVANSYKALENGANSDAWYYMVDNVEDYSHKIESKRKVNKAVSYLEEFFLEDKGIVIKLAKALENTDKDLSGDRAYEWLDEYFRRDEYAYSKYIRCCEMYKLASKREAFYAMADLQDYIDYDIIRKRDGKYYWTVPETNMTQLTYLDWSSKDKVVRDFLIAPEFQTEVQILKSVLKDRAQLQ